MAVILPDAPNCARLEFRGQTGGMPWANIMHVQSLQYAGLAADWEALATAAHTAYFNAFIPQMNTQAHLLTTTAVDISTRTGFVGIEELDHPGTATGTDFAPLNVACCLSWLIQDRYRGGHPRMYLTGVNNGKISSSRLWGTGVATAYQNAGDAFLGSLGNLTVGSTTWSPVCVRYYSQHALLPNPLIRKITGCKVGNRIDTQRRRLGKEAV